jgi:hypothetical protein
VSVIDLPFQFLDAILCTRKQIHNADHEGQNVQGRDRDILRQGLCHSIQLAFYRFTAPSRWQLIHSRAHRNEPPWCRLLLLDLGQSLFFAWRG